MKISRLLLLLALTLPAPAIAQVPDTLAAGPVEPPPPSGLAAAEIARSRRCVPAFARRDTLNTKLDPMMARSNRLRQLFDAVTREDTTRATPLDRREPIESAVTKWWSADQVLALQYSTTGDSLIEAKRAKGRDEVATRIKNAIDSVSAHAQAEIEATGELQNDMIECENVILVRSAVLEQCPPSLTLAICAAARTDSVSPVYRFVNDPLEMWDVESASLWSVPGRLALDPAGSLQGGESSASERRGNLLLSLAIRPMVQDRSKLTPEQIATIQADLDSIGFTYKHPQFVISPAIAFEFVMPEPVGGENFLFLHFGDLSQPAKDVIWSGPAPTRGSVRMILPSKKSTLDRLAAGEIVTLTAVRFADPNSKQAEAVYSIELPSLRQASSVGGLLTYFTNGQLAQDFEAIVPPAGG